jgi:5-(carboxyamino)imidazole ribonucleotide synthase
VSGLEIGPYAPRHAAVRPADPRSGEVAAAVSDFVRGALPDDRTEHVGSTAVPGLPGTGTIDLLVVVAGDADVAAACGRLVRVGFQRHPVGDPTRSDPTPSDPALVGAVEWRGRPYGLRIQIAPESSPEVRERVGFRDTLRGDARLRRDYAEEKRRVVATGALDDAAYRRAMAPWIDATLRRIGLRGRQPGDARPGQPAGARPAQLGPRQTQPGARRSTSRVAPSHAPIAIPRLGRASAAEPDRPAAGRGSSLATPAQPILPPATIGILGGGQLGRMIAVAARAIGYRIAILDPDPECPARAVSDRHVVGRYDDVRAALELAAGCAVVTYELEHVDATLVEAVLDAGVPVRPGVTALRVTQDRLVERRWVEEQGARVARWREVRSAAELRVALRDLGLPARLKAPLGGYDGRSQVRITSAAASADAWSALVGPRASRDPRLPATARRPSLLVEEELPFECELSVVVARGLDGAVLAFPVARNAHDNGILIESVAPAPIPPLPVALAQDLGERLARALDVVGTLTVELFLLADGSLAVNELAPRVHNSAHWTIEACRTSQFEQHVRAICGLPLGSIEMTGSAAMVNLLGSGSAREARLTGVAEALADPDAKLHLYDKRRVFERRKMGHLTVVSGSPDEAIARARRAAAHLGWA